MNKFGGIVKAGILYLTGIADWRMKYQNLIPENIIEMVQPDRSKDASTLQPVKN